jgi:putative transposase
LAKFERPTQTPVAPLRRKSTGAYTPKDLWRLYAEKSPAPLCLRVKQVLQRLGEMRGLPASITVDNGPEFAGKALDSWAYEAGVTLSFIRPGKPVENAYIESFNGRFRDECLNEHWFMTMRHARSLIESWRIEYNTERPHSSLGYLTPEQFAQAHEEQQLLTSDSNSGPD